MRSTVLPGALTSAAISTTQAGLIADMLFQMRGRPYASWRYYRLNNYLCNPRTSALFTSWAMALHEHQLAHSKSINMYTFTSR